uniref:Immune-related, lectin-like receptor 4 n=1 Tax=Sinocyclocheilus rhinocerous TaxID=307959 RepID=A0A673H3R8_9TELE
FLFERITKAVSCLSLYLVSGYYTQFSSPLKMIAHLKCNKLLACPKNWDRDACISDDGHLVIINSRDEQVSYALSCKEFLIGIIKTEESFWIGLTDEKIEDQWLWVDNRNLCKDKSYWTRKEPDNWKGYGGEYPSGEDCAHIHKNSIQDLKSWFDAVCNKALRRICETRSSRQT